MREVIRLGLGRCGIMLIKVDNSRVFPTVRIMLIL